MEAEIWRHRCPVESGEVLVDIGYILYCARRRSRAVCFVGLGIIMIYWHTLIRKVFAEREVLWQCLGGNGSIRAILRQTCAVQITLSTVTDFRVTHKEYAGVIKAQSGHIKW